MNSFYLFISVLASRDATARAELVTNGLQACLEHRTQFLQSRIDEVEACKDIVRQLVASHAHALRNSLVDEDLLFKRSSLEPEVNWSSCVFFLSKIADPFLSTFVLISGLNCYHEHKTAVAAVH